MRAIKKIFAAASFCAIGLIHAPSNAQVVFQVDATQSQVTVSGNIVAYGTLSAPMSAQTPGSLTTVYSGSVNVARSNSTLQFTGSSFIAAENNPTPQQPAPGGSPGSAPADYGATAQQGFFGFTVIANAAVRNLALDLTGPLETVTNGDFDASPLQFSFSTNVDGTIDYLDNIGDSGSDPLTGSATESSNTTGTLDTTGSVQTLTLPVNVTFTQNSGALQGTTLHMSGKIVAARTLPAPVIDSITVSNGSVVLTVENATLQSQTLVSTNLNSWLPPAAATITNRSDLVIFTLAPSGSCEFFKIRQ